MKQYRELYISYYDTHKKDCTLSEQEKDSLYRELQSAQPFIRELMQQGKQTSSAG